MSDTNKTRSGGVKTPAGKAISRRNAQKHAILSQTITPYDNGVHESIFEQLNDDYKANSVIENILLERIAVYYVKLYRVAKAEKEAMSSFLNPHITKFQDIDLDSGIEVVKEGHHFVIDGTAIETLQGIYGRYEITIENRLYKALHELERIQRYRRGEFVQAPVAVDMSTESNSSFGEKPL